MIQEGTTERTLLRHIQADAQYERGLRHLEQGDYEGAIKRFARAIRLDRRYPPYYIARGSAYSRRGEHDRAIEDYDRAIELDPTRAVAYGNRADAHFNLGNFDATVADASGPHWRDVR